MLPKIPLTNRTDGAPGISAQLFSPGSSGISIVICNYNHANYLAEAIDSALNQTVACQVIVVDDGSTDGSRDLLRRAHPRVEVVLQPNRGQAAAYNSGFERVRGDFVLFLDADDVLEPQALAVASAAFSEGVAKVHFRLRMVDDAGRLLEGVVPSTLGQGDMLGPMVRSGLLYPSAPGSGNVYRSSVLKRLFPLPVDPDDRVGADFFTIYGAIAFGRVGACEQVLGRYRLHRKPQACTDQFVFGNAALGNDESAKVETRYARLVAWVRLRTGSEVIYPSRFLDFSVLKSSYAASVLGQPYWRALFANGDALKRLLRSMWLRPEFSLKKKIGLSIWSVLVLTAPRPTASRLARHVCNPASRAT